MKGFCLICVLIGLSSASLAETIPIEIPTVIYNNPDVVCDYLRVQIGASSDTWNTRICAEEIFRVGFRRVRVEQLKAEGKAAARASLVEGREQFDTLFPQGEPVPGRPNPPRIMACGDGCIDVDAEVGINEECDDGNTENGDGCSESCVLEGAE